MADKPIYTGNEKLTLGQLNIYGGLIKNYTDNTFATKEEIKNIEGSGQTSSYEISIEEANESMNEAMRTTDVVYFE